MSDVVRKVIAFSIVILGAGLLWAGRRSYTDSEDAKDQTKATIAAARERAASRDPRLKGAYRFERGGWVYVHLEGDPFNIGFQHGYLLAPELEDAFPAVSAGMMHSSNATGLFSVKLRAKNSGPSSILNISRNWKASLKD